MHISAPLGVQPYSLCAAYLSSEKTGRSRTCVVDAETVALLAAAGVAFSHTLAWSLGAMVVGRIVSSWCSRPVKWSPRDTRRMPLHIGKEPTTLDTTI